MSTAKGSFHRDIKPGNLILSSDGVIKLLDLGLAVFRQPGEEHSPLNESLTTQHQFLGTIDYLSPEQARDSHEADARSDVYSLGATLWRFLTGHPRVGNGTPTEKLARLLNQQTENIKSVQPDLPAPLCEFIDRMLAFDPQHRVASAAEVAEFLGQYSAPLAADLPARMTQTSDADTEDAAIDVTTPGPADSALAATVQATVSDQPGPLVAEAHRGRFGRKALITAIALPLLLISGIVFRVRTNGGVLRIECENPDLEVEVLRDGRVEQNVAVGQLAEYSWFRAGDYEIRVPRQETDEIRIQGSRFRLMRGDRRVVEIEFIKDTPTDTETGTPPVPQPTRLADSSPWLGKDLQLPPSADAPFDAEQAARFRRLWADYLKQDVELTNAVGMTLRLIPPGKFQMGCPPEFLDDIAALVPDEDPLYVLDRVHRGAERPQHPVRLSRPFYAGVSEVTQGQYMAVMGHNPAHFSKTGSEKNLPHIQREDTSEFPVDGISWLDAIRFCNALSRQEGRTPCYASETEAAVIDFNADGYRLLTEAEFEHAARGGTRSLFWFGNRGDSKFLMDKCWWSMPAGDRFGPKASGDYPANAFGLEGVHGNAYEWVQDWLDPNYYSQSPSTDPPGPAQGQDKILRGGGWQGANFVYLASHSKFALRPLTRQKWSGFRVALNVPNSKAPEGN